MLFAKMAKLYTSDLIIFEGYLKFCFLNYQNHELASRDRLANWDALPDALRFEHICSL